MGKVGEQPLAVGDHRRVQQLSSHTQAEPVEDFCRIRAGDLGDAPRRKTQPCGAEDLFFVEVSQAEAFGDSVLPPIPAMGPVEQQLLVPDLLHGDYGGAGTLEGTPLICKRPQILPGIGFDGDDLSAGTRQRNPLYPDGRWRLEVLKQGGKISKSPICDELTLNRAIRSHPDQDRSASPVQESAEGLSDPLQLTGCLFEFDFFGLATGDQQLKVFDVHLWLGVIGATSIASG